MSKSKEGPTVLYFCHGCRHMNYYKDSYKCSLGNFKIGHSAECPTANCPVIKEQLDSVRAKHTRENTST